MKGYVYLIMDSNNEGTYKIGTTRGKIENRIKELQTGNSNELSICKYYETEIPFFMEKKLHDYFINQQIMNEWYQLEDKDVLGFEEKCKSIENMVESLKDNPFFPKKLK